MKSSLLTALALVLVFAPSSAAQEKAPWPVAVGQALARAGGNRGELVKALRDATDAQRRGMEFLIANMPEADLKTLHADFLLENVRLAYKARAETPWGKDVPEDVFFNDVLPYANVDEARDPWRKELYELCLPLVKDCKSPGEAARRLNEKVFPTLKVRYSTGRKKPNQSPKESIAQGKASCTGLSILLVDACRAVAVPARLVGTPLWKNGRGNHTWVEVWDRRWHFTGACEPDPKGLDRGWFVGDAAQALADSPLHAIYAASFRKTKQHFPLVWDMGHRDVFAENVTGRYAKRAAVKKDTARVLLRVWAADKRARTALPVTIRDRADEARVWRGTSRGETADTNDILGFDLPGGREYLLTLGGPVGLEMAFRTTAGTEQLLEIKAPSRPQLTPEQRRQVEEAARKFFAEDEDKRAKWEPGEALDRLLLGREAEVRELVWQAYRAAPIHANRKKDFEKNEVRFEKHVSPYTVKKVGKKPAGGWPLVIAMHGGGGVPKQINDSQWKVMQIYYRDHPEASGYLYVALRAPNDVWNGFYDNYVPPLIANLIRQFLLFGDVDSNRVFLMGYSHGGYGAFFIGPKIPDRFAAVHASAAAPTDGTISAATLRHLRFTFMIGEKDTAYGRRQRCETFAETIAKLREANKGDYPVAMEFKKGYGHGGLPDRDKIKEIIGLARNPVPRHVTWEPTDTLIKRLYWLGIPAPRSGQRIDAIIKGNAIEVTTKGVDVFDVYLDSRLVATGRPVRVTLNGTAQTVQPLPSFATLCRTLHERGDPALASTMRARLRTIDQSK